jgi:hypothetical protein
VGRRRAGAAPNEDGAEVDALERALGVRRPNRHGVIVARGPQAIADALALALGSGLKLPSSALRALLRAAPGLAVLEVGLPARRRGGALDPGFVHVAWSGWGAPGRGPAYAALRRSGFVRQVRGAPELTYFPGEDPRALMDLDRPATIR